MHLLSGTEVIDRDSFDDSPLVEPYQFPWVVGINSMSHTRQRLETSSEYRQNRRCARPIVRFFRMISMNETNVLDPLSPA